MPDTKAILELMRRESLRRDQIVDREVIELDDGLPEQWVSGDLVAVIYQEIYAGIRRAVESAAEGQPLDADPADVFERAYAIAQLVEETMAGRNGSETAEGAANGNGDTSDGGVQRQDTDRSICQHRSEPVVAGRPGPG